MRTKVYGLKVVRLTLEQGFGEGFPPTFTRKNHFQSNLIDVKSADEELHLKFYSNKFWMHLEGGWVRTPLVIEMSLDTVPLFYP